MQKYGWEDGRQPFASDLHLSQAWLERRTNFTRSLAVMSMVGHVLGLGDRHPSNIMLDQHTGKIVECDFGDSFEVCRGATCISHVHAHCFFMPGRHAP